MSELQSSLGTIFMTRLATGSILKLLVPYLIEKQKEKAESKGRALSELSEVERAYIQQEYHVILGPFADYANLTIQFGYATMFIAAYPLALIMSFVTNYVGKCAVHAVDAECCAGLCFCLSLCLTPTV
jgi:hypothetical protein